MNRTLAATCEQTVSALTDALVAHGYRVEPSFDLRSALEGHGDCPCPHHGTAQCTCQYLVLLVYKVGTQTPPASITIHESDGFTRVHVESNRGDGVLPVSLAAVIDEALQATLDRI